MKINAIFVLKLKSNGHKSKPGFSWNRCDLTIAPPFSTSSAIQLQQIFGFTFHIWADWSKNWNFNSLDTFINMPCVRIWSSIRNVICEAIHKPHGYLICIEMNTVGNYYNLLVKIDTRMHNYAQPFTRGHIGWAFLRSIIIHLLWYFIILFKCWTLHNILVALMPNSKSPTQLKY